MEKALYDTYLAILKEELVPAMGCTEPIAVAYAAALAARALGCPAEQAEVAASANIIKNVKSVVVPPHGRPPGHCGRRCRRHRGRRCGQGAGSALRRDGG